MPYSITSCLLNKTGDSFRTSGSLWRTIYLTIEPIEGQHREQKALHILTVSCPFLFYESVVILTIHHRLTSLQGGNPGPFGTHLSCTLTPEPRPALWPWSKPPSALAWILVLVCSTYISGHLPYLLPSFAYILNLLQSFPRLLVGHRGKA